MSYTINIENDLECNYINAQTQNAFKMLSHIQVNIIKVF